MKKKMILLCAAAAMIALLAVGGTLAYLTDTTETAKNTFAIGAVDGVLTENGDEDAVIDGEDDADDNVLDGETDNIYVDWDDKKTTSNIAPGQTVQKAPVVTNIGTNAAYVRLVVTGVDFYVTDDDEDAAEGVELFLPVGLNVGEEDDQWIQTKAEDGSYIFYYNSALPVADDDDADANKTTPLFTGVRLKPSVVSFTAGDENNTIAVYAELIQASYLEALPNTVTPSGNDAIDAFYWFTAPTSTTADPSAGSGE
jgi:predicted ribosomally synthesized peptide with SipW-like signal peptide